MLLYYGFCVILYFISNRVDCNRLVGVGNWPRATRALPNQTSTTRLIDYK